MLSLIRAAITIEGTRQILQTLSPHLKALAPHIKEVAAQVKPLLAPPVRTLAFLPTLGMFGAGVAVGTGIGMLTAPKPGSELRASLKKWLNGQWQQTVATKNRLFPRPNGKGTQESSGAEPAPN